MGEKKGALIDITQEQKRLSSAGRLHWFHWAIVISSLVLTFTAWYFTNSQVQQRIENQFERESNQVVELGFRTHAKV